MLLAERAYYDYYEFLKLFLNLLFEIQYLSNMKR